MSRITYHVSKPKGEVVIPIKRLDEMFNEHIEQMKNNDLIINLTDNEILEYVLTTMNNRIKREYSTYSHTLTYQYDKELNILFVSWALRHYPDIFSKKKGYEMSNRRMDKLINFNNGVKETYQREFSDLPIKIKNSYKNYFNRVKRYFKEIPEDFDWVNNVIVY